MSDTEIYAGSAVTISIHGSRCIHSRHCVLGRPDVWVPNVEGAWVHPDNAPADVIAAIAQSCPSGAIQYQRHDGGANESAPMVNTVELRENGPLAVHAELSVDGEKSSFRATLCRCGASRNKPYCDGSHHEAGFIATGEPNTLESQPLHRRDGPLDVSRTADGPLKVDGPMEIVSGTGRTITRVVTAYLCRCGGSASKPFCDGSHRQNGFKDALPPAAVP